MSRFDLETDRRAIEVSRAAPVRLVARRLPVGRYDVRCGNCGFTMTVYDSTTRLVSMYRWRLDGWTWFPRKKKHVPRKGAVAYMTEEEVEDAVWREFKDHDHRDMPAAEITLSPGLTILEPPSESNDWRRLELPVLLACYRCREKSGLDQLPDPDL